MALKDMRLVRMEESTVYLNGQEDTWWTFRRKFDAVSAVWLWVGEVLVWEFQKEVLSVRWFKSFGVQG